MVVCNWEPIETAGEVMQVPGRCQIAVQSRVVCSVHPQNGHCWHHLVGGTELYSCPFPATHTWCKQHCEPAADQSSRLAVHFDPSGPPTSSQDGLHRSSGSTHTAGGRPGCQQAHRCGRCGGGQAAQAYRRCAPCRHQPQVRVLARSLELHPPPSRHQPCLSQL